MSWPKADHCEVSVTHRLPMVSRWVNHHIQPEAAGGLTVAENRLQACDNCHMTIHKILFYMAKHQGAYPAGIGNKTQRYFAKRGYDMCVLAGTISVIPNEGLAHKLTMVEG